MTRWTQTHTKEEIVSLAQAMQFPWAPVCTPADVVANEQLRAREFFRQVLLSPGDRTAAFPGSPLRFAPADAGLQSVAAVGADNAVIYRDELGMSDRQMRDLAARGVI